MTSAALVLEDGTVFQGQGFGAEADAIFELVFNTSMTGYQEILTDPSYRGQGVLFTLPHIGNVGINREDYESRSPQISAVVVRSISPVVSNWRSEQKLDEWLAEYGVPGISQVDTRFLTRKLRELGTMRAAITTRSTPAKQLLHQVHNWSGLDGLDLVKEVTCTEPYVWEGDTASHWVQVNSVTDGGTDPHPARPPKIIVYDFGAKLNILRHLRALGADVMVVPAGTSSQQTLAYKPDGILLSNGPGDPAGLPYVVEIVSELISSGTPLFGICLGHQIIGRALGGKTERLKFGHHGGNHPVQDLRTRKVQITTQNHNYTVIIDSLDDQKVEITHLSLNDQSLEGMRMKLSPVFSVQYHPEAAPGPHDAHGLFQEFWQAVQLGAGR